MRLRPSSHADVGQRCLGCACSDRAAFFEAVRGLGPARWRTGATGQCPRGSNIRPCERLLAVWASNDAWSPASRLADGPSTTRSQLLLHFRLYARTNASRDHRTSAANPSDPGDACESGTSLHPALPGLRVRWRFLHKSDSAKSSQQLAATAGDLLLRFLCLAFAGTPTRAWTGPRQSLLLVRPVFGLRSGAHDAQRHRMELLRLSRFAEPRGAEAHESRDRFPVLDRPRRTESHGARSERLPALRRSSSAATDHRVLPSWPENWPPV